jgi:SSS family solute:Na+ symporter
VDDVSAILQATNFSSLDWGIVFAYLGISVVIGLVANRYVGNMADYIVAGRGIRTALGVATLTGTELGLVTVMYSAQKGFNGGFAAFHIALAAGIVTLVVGLSGFIIAGLRRREVLTIPDFYRQRFGRRVQVIGAIVLALGGILNMGLFLRAGSIFVVGVTGLDPDGWMLLGVMFLLLLLVLFYTILGGMISVVITDYLQYVVLSFGLLIVAGSAIATIGWNDIISGVQELKGDAGFNPFLAESAFGWEYVLWMAFIGLVSCALWPPVVARALAARDERTVRRQFTIGALGLSVRFIIPNFLGIAAFVFISQQADLRALFPFDDPEAGLDRLYALPVFLGRILPVGVLGIITAAMIAAFMSTHDSYFLCWSSVLTNDVVNPLTKHRLSERAQLLLTRLFILAIGVFVFAVSLLFPLSEDLWDYMAVTGAIYSTSAFALLTAGLYWRRASSTGAMLSLLIGCLAIFGLEKVRKAVFVGVFGLSEEFVAAQMSSERVGLLAVVAAWAALVLGSLFFPDPPQTGQKEEASGKGAVQT